MNLSDEDILQQRAEILEAIKDGFEESRQKLIPNTNVSATDQIMAEKAIKDCEIGAL